MIEGNCKVFIEERDDVYCVHIIFSTSLHLLAGWHQLKDKNIVCH